MMAGSQTKIYLFLALACFLGIVVIFVFDGYMGIYDSLTVISPPFSRTVISRDQWPQQEEYGFIGVGMERNGRLEFTYAIENHRFSAYSEPVTISVWHDNGAPRDVAAGQMSAGAFGTAELVWTLRAEDVVPADLPASQPYNFNVVIRRGGIERRVQVYVSAATMPLPAPAVPKIE